MKMIVYVGTNYTNLTNSTDRYILKKDDNGVENALLTLENVTLDDRGEYRCYGRNEANDYGNNGTNTVASDSTTVRVKGESLSLSRENISIHIIYILCKY